MEAGGVEFKFKSHKAHVFSSLEAADLFTIADLLTFGLSLRSVIMLIDFRISVFFFYLCGKFPPFSAAPGMGASPEAIVASDPPARICPSSFICKPRSRSVSRNERISAENGGRKGPGCA
jgi:hypothetical protein